MAHMSLYSNHPLPANLLVPRGLIYDPSTQLESDFVLSLLKTLREDLRLHSIFLHKALAQDPGTPTFSDMSHAQRMAYSLQTHCSFCGRRFGSQYTDPYTKRKIKILKNKDHIHFFKSSQLARYPPPYEPTTHRLTFG